MNGPDDREARLGVVVGGSLTEGVDVRLDGERSTEDVKVGAFVSIQGARSRFLGVVTDVSLETTDSALRASPPDVSDPFVAAVVSGTSAYGTIRVEPMLALDVEGYEPGQDSAAPLRRRLHGVPGRHRDGVRNRGRAPLLDRQPAGHGDASLPRPARAGQAQQRRLREVRHRKDVPDAAAARRHPAERRGDQPRIRHGERVRLARLQRGQPGGEGAQAALPLEGRGLLPRRGELAAAGPHARLRGPHRLRGDRAGGHRGAARNARTLGSGGRRGLLASQALRRVLLAQGVPLGQRQADDLRAGRRHRRQRQRARQAAQPADAPPAVRLRRRGRRARLGQPHPDVPRPRHARRARVRTLRPRHGRLRAGRQSADSAHLPPVRRTQGARHGGGDAGSRTRWSSRSKRHTSS